MGSKLKNCENAGGIEAVERNHFQQDMAGIVIRRICRKEVCERLFHYIVFVIEFVASFSNELRIGGGQGGFHRRFPFTDWRVAESIPRLLRGSTAFSSPDPPICNQGRTGFGGT